MKNVTTVFLFLITMGSNAMATTKTDLNVVTNLITTITESIGAEGLAIFPDSASIYGRLEMNSDFRKLSALSRTTWRDALDNLPAVAPGREARIVLLHSLLGLPPKEYMKCLERLTDLYEKGQIKKEEFVNIFLFSPRDENRWFLSYNANEPQMVKFLDRARSIFAQDKDVLHLIELISSGKARARDERLRSEKASLSKRKVPHLTDD